MTSTVVLLTTLASVMVAKICDFGTARKLDHKTKATQIGTEEWMAPEVVMLYVLTLFMRIMRVWVAIMSSCWQLWTWFTNVYIHQHRYKLGPPYYSICVQYNINFIPSCYNSAGASGYVYSTVERARHKYLNVKNA